MHVEPVPDGFARPVAPVAPQDLVLTLLGAHLEPRARRQVWSGGLVTLLADFDFSAGAARICLARMVQRGLLARHRSGRLVSYTLTDRAIAILAEGDRRIFSFGRQQPEDLCWTVLWQAIPEEQRRSRERLVRRLRFLGFGSLQDGTWLAPHDREHEVAALLDELGVSRYAGVLIGQPARSVDFHAVLRRIWDTDQLAARYLAFHAEFAAAPVTSIDDRAALLLRTRLVHRFRQFPAADPELPPALAPAPAGRAAAVELFHHLYPALATPAQRHFDEVTTP